MRHPTRLAVVPGAAITAAVTLVMALGGCGGSGPNVAAGGRVYSEQCARCHGDHGEGGDGPSLIGIGRVFETPEGQETFVKTGGAGMPVFGDTLTDDELRDVVAFTRETFG
jgi:quinohemoprotein ethanol dehydrogenase